MKMILTTAKKTRQAGNLLLELIIFFGIIGLAYSQLYGRQDSASQAQQVDLHLQQLQQLVTETKSTYQNQYGATGTDLVPTLIARGRIPFGMTVGAALVNPVGGAVTVVSAASGANFIIATATIPSWMCIDVGSKVRGALSATIGATTAASFTPDAAVTACGAGNSTISFTFR